MLENLNEALNKYASYCGFGIEGAKAKDLQKEFAKQINEQTGGAVMLSDLLLYEYYDEEQGIFYNRDNTAGFWYEIHPLVGSSEAIEKNLTLFFNDELPEGTYLQFLIIASHDTSQVLKIWEDGNLHGGEAIAYITKYRKWFIEKCARDFENAREGRLARNFRTFVSCSRHTSSGGGQKAFNNLNIFKRKLENKLKTESLAPRQMAAVDLIEVGRDLLQMDLSYANKAKARYSKYSKYNNLSDQVYPGLFPTIIHPEEVEHEATGLHSRVFSPKEYPESFSLSEMVALLGSSNKVIPARFVISYSIASSLGSRGSSKLVAQGNRSVHAAGRDYTRNDIGAKEEAREWIEILDAHKKGERFLSESMQVMITAPKENIEIAEETLKSIWNALDWKLGSNNNLQLLGALSLMPMTGASYWKSLSFFKLTRNALSGEVVAKLHLQGEWKGVPVSGVLMMGRRGQLFNFNPFYRIGGGGNYNVAMMAPSGAGKSFFLQELAKSMLAQNVAVFVLDIGASYKNLCQRFGGEMIRFNKDSKLSLNPFASVSNSGAVYTKALQLLKNSTPHEEIALITGLNLEKIKALAIGQSSANNTQKEEEGIEVLEIRGIDKDGSDKIHFVTKDSIVYAKAMLASMCGVSGKVREESIIERAINAGIAKYGTDLTISKLAVSLEHLTDHRGGPVEGATKLADSLFSYTEDGIHGRFFKAGDEASFKEMLTVFEFEEIKDDEPLLAVVLQVILMQVTMQFLCGDRSRNFMLLVDEAWMILDFAANFLERFARTVRKYGGSLVVCTQDLSSFSKGSAQKAILESTNWKLIMQQKEEGIATFAEDKSYLPYLELIRSVRKCSSNKFSEVLIDTNGAKVVGRLVTDPYSTSLYSTEKEDFNFLINQEKMGKSKHEAILALSKKYGDLPNLDQAVGSE